MNRLRESELEQMAEVNNWRECRYDNNGILAYTMTGDLMDWHAVPEHIIDTI